MEGNITWPNNANSNFCVWPSLHVSCSELRKSGPLKDIQVFEMVQASLNMVVAAKTNHPTTHTCRLALDFNCVSFNLVLEYHIRRGKKPFRDKDI